MRLPPSPRWAIRSLPVRVQAAGVGGDPAFQRLAGQRRHGDRQPVRRPAAHRAVGCARAGGGAGGQQPGLDRGGQLPAVRLGGGVVAHLVHQAGVEPFGAGADGAQAAPADQCHQRGEVAGGAGEQVVRQVIGQHAGIPSGQHELPLDRQQQAPPLLAARLVVDLERAHGQHRGPPPELGVQRLLG